MAKKHIGHCPCPLCGGSVPLEENEAGTLSFRCVPCDWSPYFKAHTDGNRHIRKSATLKAAPEPAPAATTKPAAPAAKPAPTPAPAPAAKPRGIFQI
jgi:hypothetical protein